MAETPDARPFWRFVSRHHDDPHRYPLSRARADYTAQPRFLAMTAHNARQDTVPVPAVALEAFQAGLTAYRNLRVLAVAAADGLATTDGRWLTHTGGRLADQLKYLADTNAYIDRSGRDLQLIAMTVQHRRATHEAPLAGFAAPSSDRRPTAHPWCRQTTP